MPLAPSALCFPNLSGQGDWSLRGYQARGGYAGLKELLSTPPLQHIEKLKSCATTPTPWWKA